MNNALQKLRRFLKLFIMGAAVLVFCLTLLFFIIPLLNFYWGNLSFAHKLNYKLILQTLFFTFKQAFFSTLLAVCLGLWGAYLISHYKVPGKKILLSLGAVPLCVPPLIVCLGYIGIFGVNGLFNNIVNLKNKHFLYTVYGIIFIQGFYNFPIALTNIYNTWKNLDQSLKHSAELLGASKIKIFFSITIPQLFTAISSAAVPVFIFCFTSFLIILLFGATGTTTLEVEIYHLVRSSFDYSSAAVLGIIETVFLVVIFFTYSHFEKKSQKNKIDSSSTIPLEKKKMHPLSFISLAFFYLVIAVLLIIPLVWIFIQSVTVKTKGLYSFSFISWKNMLTSTKFYTALLNTILTAGGTSLICIITATVYITFLLLKAKTNSKTAKTLALIPLAVSSIIMGTGILFTFNKGNIFCLILAQSALFWPFAFRIIFTGASRIQQEILDEGLILSPSTGDLIFNIIIPLLKKYIISSLCFSFALSSGDTNLPLLLSINNFDTLSLYTYRLTGSYRFTQASASGFILALLCITFYFISTKFEKEGISE